MEDSSMLLHRSVVIFLFRSIPLYKYSIISLSILLLMDIWVVFSLGILRRTFCVQIHSFLLRINLGVELLGHRVSKYLPLAKTAKEFFIVVVWFKLPPAMHRSVTCFISSLIFRFSLCIVLAILMYTWAFWRRIILHFKVACSVTKLA